MSAYLVIELVSMYGAIPRVITQMVNTKRASVRCLSKSETLQLLHSSVPKNIFWNVAIRYTAPKVKPISINKLQIQITFCEYICVEKPPKRHKNFALKPDVNGIPIPARVKIKLKAASFGACGARAPMKGSFVVLKICDAKQ